MAKQLTVEQAKKRLYEDEYACVKCGEPTTMTCEGCRRPFCSDCCSECEGYGFCIDCYPYGAAVEWDDEKPGYGEVREGSALHRRDCRMLKRCGPRDLSYDDYTWQFVEREEGEVMLARGYLKPCKVCGTTDLVERVEKMEAE